MPLPLYFLHGVLLVEVERKYTELTLFPEQKVRKKEKSKSEMVKESGVSWSIFRMFLERWDKTKRKAAEGMKLVAEREEENLPTYKLNAWMVLPGQSR